MNVSVLVTVYNLRHLAPRAIESALRQTRPPLEVLVVDDGSSDGSADALQAAFSDRIRLVRLARNGGVLLATLEGLRHLNGDVVCFLDADDAWEPDKIRCVAETFERDSSIIFVSHDYRMVDARERVLRTEDPLLVPTKRLSRNSDPSRLSDFMRASVLEYLGHVWLGSAYSIRLGALDLNAFSAWVDALPDSSSVYQDHPLATFLLTHSDGRLAFVDQKLLSYRIHNSNYSSAATDLKKAQAIVRKGLATRRATYSIVSAAGPQFQRACAAQAAKVREYEFLSALYAKAYGAAIREFSACARTIWTPRQTLKELVRLAAVSVMGPAGFLYVKHSFDRARG